jgi:hypothetical protein
MKSSKNLNDSSDKNKLKPLTDITCQITGGSGKYLGATGTVTFFVDSENVRNVTINVFY